MGLGLTSRGLGSRFGNRGRRRRSLILVSGVLLLFVVAVIYYIFFRVYDKGVRSIVVNGETVSQVDGFKVHSSTWLLQQQGQALLDRIQVPRQLLPTVTKNYRGKTYIRAQDLIAVLNGYGDKSRYADGQVRVHLKPNQHYTYQRDGDTIRQQEIWVNGKLAGRVLAIRHNEADYVSASAVSALVNQAGLPSKWNGQVFAVAFQGKKSTAAIDNPSAYRLIDYGKGRSLYAPDYVWQHQVYLPSFSIAAALQQTGWTSIVSTWKWTLTSRQAAAGSPKTNQNGGSTSTFSSSDTLFLARGTHKPQPQVLGFVPSFYTDDLREFNDVMHHQSSYNAIAEDLWTVDPSGSLNGAAPAGTVNQASAAGDRVYAMITNLGNKGFDSQEMTTILGDPSRTKELQNEILELAASDDVAGVTLDFEEIPAANRQSYSDFVSGLASDLHMEHKQLQVVVPAKTGNSQNNGSAFDLAKLGQAADEIIVMAYDYSYIGGPAGPIAPLPWVRETLAFTLSRVPAAKVVLGMDAYGYDWNDNKSIGVSLSNVDSFLKKHHIKPHWDVKAEAPWFTWKDKKGVLHTVYYENKQSTDAKLAVAQGYGLGGVAVWRAGLEDDVMLSQLSQYLNGKSFAQ